MLASDLMNPDFVGAKNPDEMLQVEFHWQPVKDMFGNAVKEDDGKPKQLLFVKIEVPGNDTTIVDTPALDHHKKRFPRQWLEFQMREGVTEASNIPGWKLEEWPELDPEQVRDLRYKRFATVEQLAGASDANVQNLGMGGAALRIKARQALASRMDAGVKAEIEARDAKIRELEEANKRRDEEMRELKEAMQLLAKARRPGRPPKNSTVP